MATGRILSGLRTYRVPLLHDPNRFQRLLTESGRPTQLIVAGNVHPADRDGQASVEHRTQFIGQPFVRPHEEELGAAGCAILNDRVTLSSRNYTIFEGPKLTVRAPPIKAHGRNIGERHQPLEQDRRLQRISRLHRGSRCREEFTW
jgi:hypothetical protein